MHTGDLIALGGAGITALATIGAAFIGRSANNEAPVGRIPRSVFWGLIMPLFIGGLQWWGLGFWSLSIDSFSPIAWGIFLFGGLLLLLGYYHFVRALKAAEANLKQPPQSN